MQKKPQRSCNTKEMTSAITEMIVQWLHSNSSPMYTSTKSIVNIDIQKCIIYVPKDDHDCLHRGGSRNLRRGILLKVREQVTKPTFAKPRPF